MSGPLVLSLFPGIGLLDRAFEEEGFCVVRGPDVLWGGDVHRFHPPAGVFEGVIGGPPCQSFSRLVHIIRAKGQTPKPNLIPEFERVVREALPAWFVMENVEGAPLPVIDEHGSYRVSAQVLNNRWFGAEQNRERRFSFGHLQSMTFPDWQVSLNVAPDLVAMENPNYERAVVATSSKEGALAKPTNGKGIEDYNARRAGRGVLPGQQSRRTIERCAELQGLPPDFLKDAPFTSAGKYQVIGNGVPLPMGRAIAKAVKRAMPHLYKGAA